MTLHAHGKATSEVDVTNISAHGLWLLANEQEHFLPFDDFPWFREARLGAALNVRMPSPGHLHWPDLDVDLDLDSIRSPESFPLIYDDPRQS
jgi:hypothetical protein